MRSGFLPARVVHIHPTRACNLACAHCYSDSAPSRRDGLDVDRILRALAVLRQEGYDIASISGGEPLVYRALDDLVDGAAAQGYRVHLITNGLLLTERRLAALRDRVFLIGVSIDGSEEVHNEVRGNPAAYRKAVRALHVLSSAGVPFGIIYAATARSLPDIPEAFELGLSVGAQLLHLRPLALEGRARSMAGGWALSSEDCTRLFLLAELLMSYPAPAPRVQLDLAPVSELNAARHQFELLRPEPALSVLSDAVNPIVLDVDGRLIPFSYGTDLRYQIGTLESPTERSPVTDLEMRSRLAQLLDRAFDSAAEEGTEYLDWFAHLTNVSRRGVAAHTSAAE